jgi:hypothetical protein
VTGTTADDDDRLTLLQRLTVALVAGVGGEQIGGTAGAVGSAVASVALGYMAGYDRQSAQQADDVLVDAQASAGITADELATWARSDDHLRLLVGVVEASWRTRNRDKLRALSVVLAEGISDDARIDVGILLAEAFRDIEAAHLRVLAHMAKRPDDDRRAWDRDELATDLPSLAEGIAPLLAALHRTGCIHSPAAFGGAVYYSVSPFGHHLLRYVRDAASER